MRAAAIIAAMVAAVSAGQAAAQTARIDPVETPRVFREAALGYCAERVHGRALIAHTVDPQSAGWTDLRPDAQTTGGQRIFSGRVSVSTGVIVDLSPAPTCFVQMNLGTSTLEATEALRAEILAVPGAVKLDEQDTPEGHHTLFGLVSEHSDAVPIFAVNDAGTDGTVTTVIVALGSKGN